MLKTGKSTKGKHKRGKRKKLAHAHIAGRLQTERSKKEDPEPENRKTEPITALSTQPHQSTTSIAYFMRQTQRATTGLNTD